MPCPVGSTPPPLPPKPQLFSADLGLEAHQRAHASTHPLHGMAHPCLHPCLVAHTQGPACTPLVSWGLRSCVRTRNPCLPQPARPWHTLLRARLKPMRAMASQAPAHLQTLGHAHLGSYTTHSSLSPLPTLAHAHHSQPGPCARLANPGPCKRSRQHPPQACTLSSKSCTRLAHSKSRRARAPWRPLQGRT